MLCVFNLSDRAQDLVLPPGDWQADTAAPFEGAAIGAGGRARLGAWAALYARAGK